MIPVSLKSLLAIVLILAFFCHNPVSAQNTDSSVDPVQFKQVRDKAVGFLIKSQAKDGSFSKQLGPAVTAMCLTGMLQNGVSIDHPSIKRGLAYLEAVRSRRWRCLRSKKRLAKL